MEDMKIRYLSSNISKKKFNYSKLMSQKYLALKRSIEKNMDMKKTFNINGILVKQKKLENLRDLNLSMLFSWTLSEEMTLF